MFYANRSMMLHTADLITSTQFSCQGLSPLYCGYIHAPNRRRWGNADRWSASAKCNITKLTSVSQLYQDKGDDTRGWRRGHTLVPRRQLRRMH